ncbi:hypothetical protein EX30DRAFT_245272 [Ascodesmis nigricans]|uniref:Uncharacterized protein n=1 Tax=Ascodesmis nigricans TaxID=341454 RepID=A0A4S2MHZ4_9PEZI|nr:hypothetical protein EX30DRAFT_245272 [Ascodesmis nigricans]
MRTSKLWNRGEALQHEGMEIIIIIHRDKGKSNWAEMESGVEEFGVEGEGWGRGKCIDFAGRWLFYGSLLKSLTPCSFHHPISTGARVVTMRHLHLLPRAMPQHHHLQPPTQAHQPQLHTTPLDYIHWRYPTTHILSSSSCFARSHMHLDYRLHNRNSAMSAYR